MKREGSYFRWRLCLQTSGIFALLPSHEGGTSRSGALLCGSGSWSGPAVGARVASLRCPILRCGHRQTSAKQEPDRSRANKTAQVDVLTTLEKDAEAEKIRWFQLSGPNTLGDLTQVEKYGIPGD